MLLFYSTLTIIVFVAISDINNTEAKQCSRSEDCGPTEMCLEAVCVNACTGRNCYGDPNAECFVEAQVPRCRCKAGYEGSKTDPCKPKRKPTCTKNEDCGLTDVCAEGACVSGCTGRNCFGDPNAECFVRSHEALCRCKSGFERVNGECKPSSDKKCNKDEECKPTEICYDNSCSDGCRNSNCNDVNAECVVLNHEMRCRCKSGYNRTKDGCRLNTEKPTTLKCSKDEDCHEVEQCSQGSCIPGCEGRNCGDTNAVCFTLHHESWCKCKAGYVKSGGSCRPASPDDKKPEQKYFANSKDVSTFKTWFDANKDCIKRGMNLPIVFTKKDDDEFKRLLRNAGLRFSWFGGIVTKGRFEWIDGHEYNYNSWLQADDPTLVDGCTAYCNHLRWGSFHCNVKQPYMCILQNI